MSVASSRAKRVLNIYDEAFAVPTSTPTTVVTYTVANMRTAYLQVISVSGENIARFQVMVNGTVIGTERSYWFNFNAFFDFRNTTYDGIPLVAGDVIVVEVLHTQTDPGDFEGRIELVEV